MKTPSSTRAHAVLSVTLILNQPQFLRVVRSVLIDQGQFAVGQVRRRQTTQGLELIIDQWSLVEGLPDGRNVPVMF